LYPWAEHFVPYTNYLSKSNMSDNGNAHFVCVAEEPLKALSMIQCVGI